MFVRVGDRIINTSRIVEVFVLDAHEAYDYGGRTIPAAPIRVILSMTGLNEEGRGREIRLDGAEAQIFLDALPTYTPTYDPGEEPT